MITAEAKIETVPVSSSEWGLIGQTTGFPDKLPGHGLSRAQRWALLGVWHTRADQKLRPDRLGPNQACPS